MKISDYRRVLFSHRARQLFVITATLISALAGPARGQTSTWKTNTSGSWSTSTRWTPTGVPVSSNTTALVFNSGFIPYTSTDDIAGTFKLNSITFNPGLTGVITVASASSSDVLQFSGSNASINNTGSTVFVTISAPVVLASNTTVNGGSGLGVVLSGGVSGNKGLTVNGILTFGGSTPATYSGKTIINGTVTENTADILSSNSDVEVNSGGTLYVYKDQVIAKLSGTGTVVSRYLSPGTNTLTVGSGDVSSEFDGTLEDFSTFSTLALTKTGAGTLTLTGANTYSGGTTLAGGKLVVGDDSALGTGLVTVSGSDTVISTTGSSGTITLANDFFLSPTLTYNIDASDPALNISGDITGNPGEGIVKKGTGTLIFSGTDTYSGSTVVKAGTLRVTGSVSQGTADFTVGDGSGDDGTLKISGSGSVTDDNGIIGNKNGSTGTVKVKNSATWTNNGDLTVGKKGTGNLVIKNSATVSNVNGIIGDQSGSTGTVTVKNSATWTNSGDLTVGKKGAGTLTIKNGGTVTNTHAVVGAKTGSSGTVTVSGGTWTNSGKLTIGDSGTGTVIIEKDGSVSASKVVIAKAGGSTGTLQIGNNDKAGTLNVKKVEFGDGSGSILFDQTNKTNFKSKISGDGTVTQEGSGTTILSGNNTYTGTTDVTDGTLLVNRNDALGASDVTVSGGTLGIKDNSAVTVINVGATYTQTSGGTLSLGLLGAATNDNQSLVVTSTAALGGTLALTTPNGGFTATPNLSYDLVHSTTGVSGQFSTVTGLNNVTLPAGFFDMITYTPQDVILYFRQFLGQISGLTPNQRAVATYIDQFAPIVTTGNFGVLVNNIYLLSTNPQALGSALDAISPQSLQVFRHIAFDNAGFTSQQIDNHLANLRDGLTGFDASQLTYTDPSSDPQLSLIQSRLLAWNPNSTPGLISDVTGPALGEIGPADEKSMRSKGASDRLNEWSTFIAGDVILADMSHDQDLAHQSYTTGSVTLGADYRIDQHWTVGGLFAYGHTDATLDHIGSTATADTYSPGVYASYVDGNWYGNALFSYGYNSYTENRNISIGSLVGTNQGAPQGSQYVGDLTGGYEFQSGEWKFGPLASLQYVNLSIDSFTEQGPTALNVQDENDESFRSQLGFDVRYNTKVISCYGPFYVTPHFSAAWQHEYLDDNRGITSQFNQIGAGSFTVQTTATDHDAAFLDLGIDAQLEKELDLIVDYETQVGQEHYFAQSFQAGVKVGF